MATYIALSYLLVLLGLAHSPFLLALERRHPRPVLVLVVNLVPFIGFITALLYVLATSSPEGAKKPGRVTAELAEVFE